MLCGPNGAGKSHILTALASQAIRIDGLEIHEDPGRSSALNTGRPGGLRLFTVGSLAVASDEGGQSVDSYRNSELTLGNAIKNFGEQLSSRQTSSGLTPDEFDDLLDQQLLSNFILSPQALGRIKSSIGKRLIEASAEELSKGAPLLNQVWDPFALQIGSVFLAYESRRDRHGYLRYLEAEGDIEPGAALSRDQFLATYGPPPWDVLNETLKLLDLPYKFLSPPRTSHPEEFVTRLRRVDTGITILPTELSSGERTLLAIALSLYADSEFSDSLVMPRVLLFDEVDAVLHPSMAKHLLRIIEDVFVGRFGVKVFLATHAPTTVALAPEGSIFGVWREAGAPRMHRISKDRALNSLLVGVPNLSLRYDLRRQVFTESPKDAAVYSEIYTRLKDKLPSSISLNFVASGSTERQGNRELVLHLVDRLRNAGNDSVFGLVDRDDSPQDLYREGVELLPNRDSVETLAYDPVVFGAFLLREKIIKYTEFGWPTDVPVAQLTHDQLREVANWVCAQIKSDSDDSTTIPLEYTGGFVCEHPRWYLDLDGHELESRLLDRWHALRRFPNDLKLEVVSRIYLDAPDLVPTDIVSVMQRLAHSDTDA